MQDSGTTEQEQGSEVTAGGDLGSTLKDDGMAQSLAFAAQLGFAIACPMVAFIGGGAWLDNRFDTVPWLLFAGILLGILAAAGTLYQVMRAQTSRLERNKRPRAPYKVEGQSKDLGTKSADKRGRNGR
ncbi:MAG: AtpZ/AtpI family protein [Chloroflexota bacterium]|nr:AtpZ/AtpI family protein [Chloroflexota bacterium]MDQ5864787.1 AtpZ/AtpI family protein [Chloroflexota bacterium]